MPTDKSPTPQKTWQILSGSVLKIIAMASMLIDHIVLHLLGQHPACNQVLCQIFGQDITTAYLMRSIGRWAFPLYCFLLVEGFVHTKNRQKYGINLLIFALLSAVPPYLEATTGYTASNGEYSPLAQAAGRFLLQLWYYGDNAETDKLQRVIDSLLKALSTERAQA